MQTPTARSFEVNFYMLSTVSFTQNSGHLSWRGHFDFPPFKIIATKPRLEGKIDWFLFCAMNISIHYCCWIQGTCPSHNITT